MTSPSTAAPRSHQPGARRLVLAALLALVAITAILGALSFARKVQTFQPMGFELAPRGSSWVVAAVEPGSALRAGDVLLLVNGEQVFSRKEAERQLRRRRVSEILVDRDGRLERVQHQLPPLDLDVPYLVLSVISALYLFIGFYILRRGINRQVVLFNLWCVASAALYLLSPVPTLQLDRTDQLISIVDEIARLLLPPLTLHFFLVFPRELTLPRPFEGWLNRLIPLSYLPSAALLAFQLDWAFTNGALFAGAPTPSRLIQHDRLTLILLVAYVLVAIAVLITHVQQAARWEHGRQVIWITLGLGVGYLPFVALHALPLAAGFTTSEAMTVAAVVPLALVPLSFAYAILRYRLWDIAVIVRDVTTYTLTLLLGAVGFSLLNILIRRGIPEDMELVRSLTTVASGLMVAGLLIPTKQSIGSTLERFHYRRSFGRRKALLQFGHELLHERDLDRLSTGLLQEIEESIDLERCNLFLVEGADLVPVREEQPETQFGPQHLLMARLDDEIWSKDYIHLHGIGLPAPAPRVEDDLFLMGYRAAFPLTVRDRRIGVVVTGLKEGHVPLNSDDALLIRQLLNQAALAIENAQLLEQMQRQLREVIELKQFNEEIIESSPAGIAVLDDDERIVTANLAFAALVGYERSGLKRRDLRSVLPLEELPHRDGSFVETTFTDDEGREHLLQLSIASFVGERPHGLRVLVINDVTEFAEMEKALAERERLAALGIMAAGVAHEVNTPLTGISSYAQMLLARTPQDDPRRELLVKVERQTFRAARIVNNLLEFARASKPDAERVGVRTALDECLDLLAERFEQHGVTVSIEDSLADAGIRANNGELEQVFTNILLNAVDALEQRPQPRQLEISLDGDDSEVWVGIADNGPGIPKEILGQVFQPFFSTKLDRGGTGLGLSLSHEIVRRHGGELSVRNRPGEGCVFTVRVPRNPGSPIEQPPTGEGTES